MGPTRRFLFGKQRHNKKQTTSNRRGSWYLSLVFSSNEKCFSAQNTTHNCNPQHEYRMGTKSRGEKSECPQAIHNILATFSLGYWAKCLIPGVDIVFEIAYMFAYYMLIFVVGGAIFNRLTAKKSVEFLKAVTLPNTICGQYFKQRSGSLPYSLVVKAEG